MVDIIQVKYVSIRQGSMYEVIRLANERAGESYAGVLPIDVSFGQAFSFASEVSLEEDCRLS